MSQKKKSSKPSVQKYLNIAEIRDDCIVMKDESLRAVLMVSSINFALKSEEEQNAIIQAYVSFLNTLEKWPIQIIIQSRALNIGEYIQSLEKRKKEITNDLLRIQISEYIQYIEDLISMSQIMSKKFFIVVPYNALGDQTKGFWYRLGNIFNPLTDIALNKKRFEERKVELWKRVNFIASGLESMGLKLAALDTQGLIEMLYNCYNPESATSEKIAALDQIQVKTE